MTKTKEINKEENIDEKISRRRFINIITAATAGGVLAFPGVSRAASWVQKKHIPTSEQRYKIGVCDWMILQRQDIEDFPLAKKIGVDGVEVDMGSLGDRKTFESKLNDPEIRKKFLNKVAELNLEICSMAMSGFYAQSFAERPTALRMVQDCIDTMAAMNVE